MNHYIKFLKLQLKEIKPIVVLVWVLTWCFHKFLLSDHFFSQYWIDYAVASSITLNSIFIFYTVIYLLDKHYNDKKLLKKKLLQFLTPDFLIFASIIYIIFGVIGPNYYPKLFYPDINYLTLEDLQKLAREWTMYYGYTFLYILVTTLAAISIFSEKKNQEAIFEMNKLKALQSESELQSLKNQINPHFLFNALSNIYSISYLGDKRAPGKIMQLSKMLRYVLYECNQDFVLLSNEIEYLTSYIDFQKIKVEHNQVILFDHINLEQQVKIAPMLLLPLVENAFKHSAIQRIKSAYIKIELTANENGDIFFTIKNSVPVDKSHIVQDDIGGIGIENLRKRLNILYNNRYTLSLKDEGESFEVSLKLITKK
ncbi:MAG: sensor histidine kinase [Flavobacteriales bacterium]